MSAPVVHPVTALLIKNGAIVIEADVADPYPSNTFPVIVTVVVIADTIVLSVNVVVFVPLDVVVFADTIVATPDETESA
jgi:hypothetical protein